MRTLFLTLFLRGRSARGLRKDAAPKSVGSKLAWTLVVYSLFGCLAFLLKGHPVFSLSVYLHAMTLMFVGMFAAASAGEVLFNREEADILMHRPVTARNLLRAKIGVLVQVSLWLAIAFNLAGLFAGAMARDGGWWFPLAHLLSTALLAMFCISCVVLMYELCLRWFGRERLDGLMTTAQVVLAIAAILGGQLVPHLIARFDARLGLSARVWWSWLLPPAWFGGLDDALAGSRSLNAWLLAAWGVTATLTVMWVVFGRLARDYGAGLQTLNESVGQPPANRGGRRWLDRLVAWPPMKLWLPDSVSRATFLLVAAYLVRDRDVKLRVYPGLAPLMVMPLILLIQGRASSGPGTFGVAFAGTYLGVIPLLGIGLLQYSQQWQAADVFRAAPVPGPAALNRGLRRAVLLFLVGPMLAVYALLSVLFTQELAQLALMLPGILALPVFAMIPCLNGEAVPLAKPADEAKSAGRGVQMIGAMLASGALAGVSMWAWSTGWFLILLIVELMGIVGLHFTLGRLAERAQWKPLE